MTIRIACKRSIIIKVKKIWYQPFLFMYSVINLFYCSVLLRFHFCRSSLKLLFSDSIISLKNILDFCIIISTKRLSFFQVISGLTPTWAAPATQSVCTATSLLAGKLAFYQS